VDKREEEGHKGTKDTKDTKKKEYEMMGRWDTEMKGKRPSSVLPHHLIISSSSSSLCPFVLFVSSWLS